MEDIYIVRNLNEELVDALIGECMAQADMCRCARCVADVRAYALNQLKPNYVTTTKGYVFSRMQCMTPQNYADILTAIAKAVQVVHGCPRH